MHSSRLRYALLSSSFIAFSSSCLYTSWLYRPLPDYNIIYNDHDDDYDNNNNDETNNNNNNSHKNINKVINDINISHINDNKKSNKNTNNYHKNANINIDNHHNCQNKIIQRHQSQYYKLTDNADRELPILYYISSQVVIFITSIVVRTFLFYGGEYKLIIDDNYYHFLKLVYDRHYSRSSSTHNNHYNSKSSSSSCSSKFIKNDINDHVNIQDHNNDVSRSISSRPLLTISNHRSLMDDPMILSSILPFWIAIQPKYNRYSVCAQEYCFNSNLPQLFHTYIGLGKVLPIKRGYGVNQQLFLDFAHLLAANNWCHIFPEGGIWQKQNKLGGRDNNINNKNGKRIEGNLKWGVGKLIAHCPTQPIVIPFYHFGTENTYPQHPDTKIIKNIIPYLGHKVTVRFGCEIIFDDLIEEHERIYGKLWKYKSNNNRVSKYKSNDRNIIGDDDVDDDDYDVDDDDDNDHHNWISKPNDYILYSKITLRIEEALLKLMKQQHQNDR